MQQNIFIVSLLPNLTQHLLKLWLENTFEIWTQFAEWSALGPSNFNCLIFNKHRPKSQCMFWNFHCISLCYCWDFKIITLLCYFKEAKMYLQCMMFLNLKQKQVDSYVLKKVQSDTFKNVITRILSFMVFTITQAYILSLYKYNYNITSIHSI